MSLRMAAAILCFAVVTAGCDCRGHLVDISGVLHLEPTELDFGDVPAFNLVEKTVAARNSGQSAIDVTALRIEVDKRDAFKVTTAPFTVEPGKTVQITVSYRAPVDLGPDTATLVVEVGTAELRVPLKGRSVDQCAKGTSVCGGACVDTQKDKYNCGGCGLVCVTGTCVSGACACVKLTCNPIEGVRTECGTTSDGCGGTLDCGGCSDGGFCSSNKCSSVCVPRTCASPTLACGSLSDGCGQTLHCGGCGDGGMCLNNQCATSCVPTTTCASAGASCGTVNDGCGHSLNCGSCADAGTCQNNQCTCVPTVTCTSAGAVCGPVNNGCGVMLDCGGCGDGGSCQNNPCACVPLTCQTAGTACGATTDGCGHPLNCGGCTNGAACQGNQCVCAGGVTEACGDGVDNNCDGNIDCLDPQCSGLPACAQQPCTLTDPEVQVTTGGNGNEAPAILWTGSDYGIFFLDQTMMYGFVRVDQNLNILTPQRYVTASTTAHQPFPVWTGTEYGIGWSDTRGSAMQYSNDVYFNRFSPTTGLAMSSSDLGISTGPGLAFPGATGWNSAAGEFGVLYADEGPNAFNQRRTWFQRVDASGNKLGASQKVSPAGLTNGNADYGHLAWAGSKWGAVWTEGRNGANIQIYFSRLTSAGVPEPVDTQVSLGAILGFFPRVASSGSAFGITYNDIRTNPSRNDIYFQRFDSATPTASALKQVTTSGKASWSDLVWTGTNWAVVYVDTRGGYGRVYYAKLDVDGNKIGPEQLISCQTLPANVPTIAFDGSKVTVAFSYTLPSKAQVFLKRFTP